MGEQRERRQPAAERGVCQDAAELRRTTGVEVGEAAGLNEMDKPEHQPGKAHAGLMRVGCRARSNTSQAAGLRESWKGPLPREAGLRGLAVTTYRPSGSFDRLATFEVAGR